MVRFNMTGLEGLEAEITRRLMTTEERARASVEDYAEHVRSLTYQLSPVDTGFMREHVRGEVEEAGSVFAFETGWHADDFRSEGFAPYYIFQEFGTVFHAPQPSLTPAWLELRPSFIEDAREIVNDAMTGG